MTKEDFYNKWEIHKTTALYYRKIFNIDAKYGDYTQLDIELEDRLNVKKLAQNLMADKTATDIKDLFNNKIQNAYKFIITLFNSRVTITNNSYDKCMLIINKFKG